MTDTENTRAHGEPKSKTPSISTVSESLLFKSGWQEFGFVMAVMLGQSFNLTPIRSDIERSMSWIAAGFSITTGSFVLVGGRLGDVYGHRIVWLLALAWSMIWNLVSDLPAPRGLTGIGAGLMLPTAVALLGQTYPPGRKRNLAFGLFGALAPFSAAGGSVLEVLLAQLVNPQWIWWLHAIKNALNLAIAIPCIPTSIGVGLGGSLDWLGACLGVVGLILFNCSFNTSRRVGVAFGDRSSGDRNCDASSLCSVGNQGAKSPILPFGIWKAPTFLSVMCSAFLSFMSFGIFIFYHIQFIHDFRRTTALQGMAWLVPFTINGFIAACLVAALISRVPAQVIFCAGLVAVMIANILTMTAPVSGSYWAASFVAALIAPFGPDMTFTATQYEQGVAGSLVGTALNYGSLKDVPVFERMALGIGLGGAVEAYTNAGGTQPLRGLRGAMYLDCGMAVLGISIVVFLVRVPKDKREGYDDEEEVPEKSTTAASKRNIERKSSFMDSAALISYELRKMKRLENCTRIQMIKDENMLEASPIWQGRSIDHKIFSFYQSKSKMNFTHALFEKRCGYTMHFIIFKNEDPFDPYDGGFELLELKDFISFDSNACGDIMQPEDANDDLLDDLHRKNIKAMNGSNNAFFSQPPPRQRKRNIICLEDAEDNSLSDKSKPKTPKPQSKVEGFEGGDREKGRGRFQDSETTRQKRVAGRQMESDLQVEVRNYARERGNGLR
ncbi:major facilitator superfamily domain-containing protein [Mycena olivaceomarginata]|nr:major facilitator superfamily domain-containing protein [Mycena olivaceomarginata]